MPFIILHNFDTRNIEPVNSELNLADSLINFLFLSFEGIDLIAPNNNEAFLPNIRNSISNESEIQPSTIESHITRKNERRPESNPFSTARNSATSQRRGVGMSVITLQTIFFGPINLKKKSLFSYLPTATSKSSGLLIAPVNKQS